jgi:CDP-paratose 2-epimerase
MARPITIYGDGKQIRDLLHVSDLIRAYDLAVEKIDVAAGQVYNLGGGSANTLSIWTEFGPLLEELVGRPIEVARGDWRPGDQRVFVADVRKAEHELGWKPQVSVEKGVRKLFEWVRENKNLF